ncbi:MAG: ActR/PrrA/RegA family redox response regulator transcription factor [Maricaulaceae bacterium]
MRSVNKWRVIVTHYDIPEDNTLLILDDDGPFRKRLGRAMEHRGFTVTLAESVIEAQAFIRTNPPAFAVLDMRLEDGNGLDVIEKLNILREDCKMVMLTGYSNLTTAVTAVKRGAVNYLAKPADADDVCKVLLSVQDEAPEIPDDPMSANRVRWEHIQRVYELCNNNVSESARRLKMHRRTLQRILGKRAPH